MRILLVSRGDLGGGAEISAWKLFNTYRSLGHESRIAVGRKQTKDPDVLEIPGDSSRSAWARFWIQTREKLTAIGGEGQLMARMRELCSWTAEPLRTFHRFQGYEDYDFPGTWDVLGRENISDIVHCFNLHEAYFDLRILPWLSHRVPVVLDLRDAWLLSGHCAHSFDCDRWKTGCGQCPDLQIYPAIPRDATAVNWIRKQQIFSKSRLYVAAPSNWLMKRIRESMLAPFVVESRVVPTGVDLDTFHPADAPQIRARLNIPQDARVLLFAANGIRKNRWKDYRTMRASIQLLAGRMKQHRVMFVALGETSPDERMDEVDIRFVPHIKDARQVAEYYQAADVYVHAAAVDTFPRAVLEALACGTPVVATAAGGIPEQIRSLDDPSALHRSEPTGIIVPPADAESMAEGIYRILTNETLYRAMSANAASDARQRFDVMRQASSYLDWYRDIIQRYRADSV